MILNKFFRHFKENKILDLKYIIVEIALIFAGITLAAKYNNYQNQLKDEAFLKETISQIYDELNNSIEKSKNDNKNYKKFILDLKLTKNILIHKNKDSLESQFFRDNILLLTVPFHKKNDDIGYQTLIDKNISLIKNKELRYKINKYYDEIKTSHQNIDYVNSNVLEINKILNKTIIINDYNTSEFQIIDKQNIYENNEFINCLSTGIISFSGIQGDNKYFTIRLGEELIKNLEKEYPYLKEENK